MHKKDYKAIAKAIKESTNPVTHCIAVKVLLNEFIIIFKQDNPLFDEDKFRQACRSNL